MEPETEKQQPGERSKMRGTTELRAGAAHDRAIFGPSTKVRLSLDVSQELYQVLDEIARMEETTKADVLRRSIALMQVAVEAKRQGLKFGAADQDQVLKTEIVGI